jgi:hypothetical protein
MFLFNQDKARRGALEWCDKRQPEVAMQRRFALLLVVLAAALLSAVPAVGAKSYSTKVIVSLKNPAFHGKLKSNRSACTTNRTVKLFRKKPGPDKLLGTDKSNAKTRWSIRIRLKSGASYYAKTPTKGSCRAAKSKVLTIG